MITFVNLELLFYFLCYEFAMKNLQLISQKIFLTIQHLLYSLFCRSTESIQNALYLLFFVKKTRKRLYLSGEVICRIYWHNHPINCKEGGQVSCVCRYQNQRKEPPNTTFKNIFLEAKSVGYLIDCMLRIKLKISTVRIGLQFSGKINFDSGQVLEYLLL